MLNEMLLSIHPIWLILIITIGEGILIGVLNSRVQNNNLPEYYMYLSIAAYNLLIGLLLHEVGRVNMEVIYRNYAWEGRLSKLETSSFIMRYLGLIDAILGIIYIVVAFFKFLEEKMASMYYGLEEIIQKSKSNEAVTDSASSSNTPAAKPSVVAAKMDGKDWICKKCGTRNTRNTSYCTECYTRHE